MRVLAASVCIAVAIVIVPGLAAASSPSEQANELAAVMRDRGASDGAIHLAVAAFFVRQKMPPQVLANLKAARRLGISSMRINLVLGDLYRRQGRYDAALSTFVRVLVKQPSQPYALVQLWRSLYEARLRQVALNIDPAMVRERLLADGLYFPAKVELGANAHQRSKKVAADGYNALLSKRSRFAIEIFKEALEIFPGNGRAHRGLAIAWKQQRSYRKAAGAYLLYLHLEPTAADGDEVDAALVELWRSAREAE